VVQFWKSPSSGAWRIGLTLFSALLFGGALVAQQQQPLAASYLEQSGPIDAQMQAEFQTPPPANQPSTAADNGGWHFEFSPYFWLAGTHGTVGALNRNASVRASPADLLSHFDLGIMGSAGARYNRFLLTGDLLWIRLSDSSALPFPNLNATSADVRVGQLFWTSKVGYRLVDHERLQVDANVGMRFWHLGQKLSFSPSRLGLSFNPSQNWADIVLGGRIELPAGPRTSVFLLGDVGGWNATANLDYQFAALLGYKIRPKWTLVAGYRYLFVDYRNAGGIYNMVTSGAVLGASYRFK